MLAIQEVSVMEDGIGVIAIIYQVVLVVISIVVP